MIPDRLGLKELSIPVEFPNENDMVAPLRDQANFGDLVEKKNLGQERKQNLL